VHELAAPATTLVRRDVTQADEDRVLPVEGDDVVGADVAGADVAGADVAGVDGRKPEVFTDPSWEMNMVPLPDRLDDRSGRQRLRRPHHS
jgi:hypothetical protein